MKISASLSHHEIPGRVALLAGNGGLTKLAITTPASTGEIYLLGAHVTGFQHHGEPPLLFMSHRSWFAAGKPIRGGVPICYPWFGPREGDVAHGFARIAEWELVKTAAAPDGTVTVTLRLPEIPGRTTENQLRTEFTVTVAATLTMELATTNAAAAPLEFENCLHTYFQVGAIGSVSLIGLQNAPLLDHAAGGNGARKVESDPALRITHETNRIYPDAVGPVEIRDEKFRRIIRVDKSGSASTVVWNPWTTQKLPDDFDPAEHAQMVCVESGNVKQNRVALAPGATARLRVELSRRTF